MFKSLVKTVTAFGKVLVGRGDTPIFSGNKRFHAPVLVTTLSELQVLPGVRGLLATLTDYDSPLWRYSDKLAKWVPLTGWSLVQDCTVHTLSSVNGASDYADNAIATYNIPAGILVSGMTLRIRWLYTVSTGTSVNKYCWPVIGGVSLPCVSIPSGGTLWRQSEVNLVALDSSGTFKLADSETGPAGISSTNPVKTIVIDTNNPVPLVFNAKFATAVAGESFALVRVEVELIK